MEGNGNNPTAHPLKMQLVIELDQLTGGVSVNGAPMANPMLAFGMIEMAKAALTKQLFAQNDGQVKLAGAMPVGRA